MTTIDFLMIGLIFAIVLLAFWCRRETLKAWEKIEQLSPEEKHKAGAGTLNSSGWL
jgi:hypothetical protein